MNKQKENNTAQATESGNTFVYCLPVKPILELLALRDYYGVHEYIEIAKGRNHLPRTWRATFKNIKRQMKWQKRSVTK